MKRTIKDDLMDYVHREMRGGPVLGPHIESIAVSRFGRTPSCVTARLRELRQDGFLTQTAAQMGNSDKRFVAYSCDGIQYDRWLAMRVPAGRPIGRASSPPLARPAAGHTPVSEQTTLGGIDGSKGHWQW